MMLWFPHFQLLGVIQVLFYLLIQFSVCASDKGHGGFESSQVFSFRNRQAIFAPISILKRTRNIWLWTSQPTLS